MTEMTVLDKTLAALAEVNPPVAAAVKVIGANRVGQPRVGLWGWLLHDDLVDACRAVCLAYDATQLPEGDYWWDWTPEALVVALEARWRRGAVDDRNHVLPEAFLAYNVARGRMRPIGESR